MGDGFGAPRYGLVSYCERMAGVRNVLHRGKSSASRPLAMLTATQQLNPRSPYSPYGFAVGEATSVSSVSTQAFTRHCGVATQCSTLPRVEGIKCKNVKSILQKVQFEGKCGILHNVVDADAYASMW